MTDHVSANATKNPIFERMVKFLAKSASAKDMADMLGDATIAKGEGEASSLAGEVDDLWTGEGATKPQTDIEVGGGVKAKGNQPSDMIRVYSPDQATQMGAVADATQLGMMLNGLKEVRKAVSAIGAEHALMKGILIKLAKAEPEKDVKDEVEEEKKEGDEDKEFSKAVAAIVAKAQPLIAQAKERIETAKSMVAAGFKPQAEVAKSAAAEHFVKALKLIEAAKAMDPANAGVIALAKSADEVKDEFGNATKEEEVKKAEESDDKKDDKKEEAAKAVPTFAPEHVASFERAAAELNIAKATIHQLFDKIRGQPSEIAKSKPELPLGKGQESTMEGLQAIIIAKSATGELSAIEAQGAMDMTALREADVKGLAPKGMFDSKLATMPSAVQALFNTAA